MSVFKVPDMSCGHCKSAVETALRKVDAGADVVVKLEENEVWVASRVPDADLIAALAAAGYPATVEHRL